MHGREYNTTYNLFKEEGKVEAFSKEIKQWMFFPSPVLPSTKLKLLTVS